MTNKIKKRYNQDTYDNLLKAGFDPHKIENENVCLDIVKLVRVNNYRQ